MDNIKKYEPFFSSWYVDELIGEGEFGKVYKIHRSEYGKEVDGAMKIVTVPYNDIEIRTALADGVSNEKLSTYYKSFVDRIVATSSAVSELNGHNNLACYEECTLIHHDDGIGWDIILRMDLLSPLSSFTVNNEIEPIDVIRLGIELCNILERCHAQGIVHRNIKPENIFIGGDGTHKLGDFGIADSLMQLNRSVKNLDAFAYAAPEVYKNEESDKTADIYALGMVMYKLLNNNRLPLLPPYPKEVSPEQKDDAIIRRLTGAALLSPANSDLRLAKAVLKACAYAPKDRYQNVSLLRQELEDILFADIRSKKNSVKTAVIASAEPAVSETLPETDIAAPQAAQSEEISDVIQSTQGAIGGSSPSDNVMAMASKFETVEEPGFDPSATTAASLAQISQSAQDRSEESVEEVAETKPQSGKEKIISIVALVIAALVFLGVAAYILISSGIINFGGKDISKVSDGTFGLYTYDVMSDDTARISGYTGAESVITVPDTLNGLKVTAIGEKAFMDNGTAVSINLPVSIKTIGVGAFYNCDAMTSVIIPAEVSAIGEGAFANCDTLFSVSVPASVTQLGSWAFAYCPMLSTVTIENGITEISYAAFYNCDNLASITIPESVVTIGEAAFSDCAKLDRVIVPSKTQTISNYAFSYCPSLANIYIPASVTSIGASAFDGSDNVLITTQQNAYAAQYCATYGIGFTMEGN